MSYGVINRAGGKSSANHESLAREIGRLGNELQVLKTTGATTTTANLLTAPEPNSPFIVDRRKTKRGEKVSMSIAIPSDAQAVKAVIRERIKTGPNSFTMGPKISFRWDEITDTQRSVGDMIEEFPEPLEFRTQYHLTRLISFDDQGRAKNPETDQSDAQDLANPLVVFTTGNPGAGQAGAHQGVRNGRFGRSVRRANNDVGTANEALECWLWHMGTRRDTYLRAAGHSSAPPANFRWNKPDGTAEIGTDAFTLAQRLKTRLFRGGDVMYCNMLVKRPILVTSAIVADIVVRLVSVSGSTTTADGVRTILAQATASQVGQSALATALARESALGLVAPAAIIDPDPDESEVITGVYYPLEFRLDMPAGYNLSQTPEPGAGHNNGQWLEIAIQAVSGAGNFSFDAVRLGYTPGGWIPHPEEETGTVGDVEITSGGGRGTAGYGPTYSDINDPGVGIILGNVN